GGGARRLRFVRSPVARGRILTVNAPPEVPIITAAALGDVKPISFWSGTATASVGVPRHPIYEEIDQLAQKLDPHRKCQLNWTHCGSGGETDEDPRRPREMPGPQPLQGGGARVVCTRPFWQRKRRGRWPRASGICGEGTDCHCQLPRVCD